MHRLLATVIFAYAGLCAAQWGRATRWLYPPPGVPRVLYCGNVLSDPFRFLASVVAPIAAACAAALVVRCVKARRWPGYAVTALLTFAVTSACLVYEARILGDYGVPIGGFWWLPWS